MVDSQLLPAETRVLRSQKAGEEEGDNRKQLETIHSSEVNIVF